MIRPITMQAQVAAISLLDAALDIEKADAAKLEDKFPEGHPRAGEVMSRLDKYLHERAGDPSVFRKAELPVRDGMRLTVFAIGVIPPAELNRIEDECRVGRPDAKVRELNWRCFLASVREIEGWGGSEDVRMTDIGGVKYVDPVWLSKMFAGRLRKVALDIGMQAWSWNQVLEHEVKN